MKNAFLVIDYNNTRFTDVAKVSKYVREQYGLVSVLIRKNPAPHDSMVVDTVIDLDHRAPDFVEQACETLERLELKVEGGFVFSDRAMIGGTKLLAALGVPHDTIEGSGPALDKSEYRRVERQNRGALESLGVTLPRFSVLRSLAEAQQFLVSCKNGVVIKPTSEGNNRGVVLVETAAQMEAAWELVRPYSNGGIIGEERIPFSREFSFDGVGNIEFVTRKISESGPFPVEVGQEIPCRIAPTHWSHLLEVGRVVRAITGTRVGGFHHEIRSEGVGQTAVVEPNRRPAGMHIWDLASRVYGVDLFHALVDSCLGRTSPTPTVLKPRGIASIRMLRAPLAGVFNEVGLGEGQLLARLHFQPKGVEMFGFRLLAQPGSWVEPAVRNNGDFIAQVCAWAEDAETPLQSHLDAFETSWARTAAELIENCWTESA